jgi:hypothetical protein
VVFFFLSMSSDEIMMIVISGLERAKSAQVCLQTQDRVFEPRSGQIKNYKIGMCCFSTKHTTLRSKSKDWLAHNQNNVSEWSDMSE